jgi:hypothetical protein
LAENTPFTYVVQTNILTGERATLAKEREDVTAKAAAIAGDSAHNLRSALDHAYWDIVHPFANTPDEERKIQFPFASTEERLARVAKSRLADRVSEHFFESICLLKPYAGGGGNFFLYLIEYLDIPDKHRTLIPVGDYTRLSTDMIRHQVPDFPAGLTNVAFGRNRRDVVWHVDRIAEMDLGEAVPPTTYLFEKSLVVPVEVRLAVEDYGLLAPMVPTLRRLVDAATEAINIMRLSAAVP